MTILDMSGAEKLVGKGDMLFNPLGSGKPKRIQGPFISDEEVKNVIDFVKAQVEDTESVSYTHLAKSTLQEEDFNVSVPTSGTYEFPPIGGNS